MTADLIMKLVFIGVGIVRDFHATQGRWPTDEEMRTLWAAKRDQIVATGETWLDQHPNA